jgi:fructose-bisphosphate aldolase class II
LNKKTALFTSEKDVDNFLAADVDVLAPSIGNVHGDYGPAGPKPGQLHFDRLESIHKQINGRVVIALHGTNDFPPAVMRQAIDAGAVKLNVNKLCLEPGNEVIRKHGHEWGTAKLLDEVVKAVVKETERWMDVCGSSGKA